MFDDFDEENFDDPDDPLYIDESERRARERHDREAGRQWAILLGLGAVLVGAVTWSLSDPGATCYVIFGLLALGTTLALIWPADFAMIISGGHLRRWQRVGSWGPRGPLLIEYLISRYLKHRKRRRRADGDEGSDRR